MKNDNQVSAGITEVKIQEDCINIVYLQVNSLGNNVIQNEINELIKKEIYALIPGEGCKTYGEIFGKYEIGVNKNGVLSVVIQFYTIRKMAANGLDVQKAITVNLNTGQVYQFYDLFKPGSKYRIFINKIIKQQIEEKELPMIKEFKGVNDYENYYLTENALVIYFNELEYTAHSAGIPEFVIPYTKLRNLVREDSPIAILMGWTGDRRIM